MGDARIAANEMDKYLKKKKSQKKQSKKSK
jgi:hypothetical protein